MMDAGGPWYGLASLAGFEPATRCLEGSRSVQLSYRDNGGLHSSVAQRAEFVPESRVSPGAHNVLPTTASYVAYSSADVLTR